jgi:hypothetical protein
VRQRLKAVVPEFYLKTPPANAKANFNAKAAPARSD